jgi:hypothetical protein
MLTMCHVELYLVWNVTAVAHNGNDIMELASEREERGGKRVGEGNLKRNISFAFHCFISRFRRK